MKAGTMLYHAMGIRPSTVGKVQAFSDNVFHITFRIHIPLAASKRSFPSILTYRVDQFLIIIFSGGDGWQNFEFRNKDRKKHSEWYVKTIREKLETHASDPVY